jgi:hypothetical protein
MSFLMIPAALAIARLLAEDAPKSSWVAGITMAIGACFHGALLVFQLAEAAIIAAVPDRALATTIVSRMFEHRAFAMVLAPFFLFYLGLAAIALIIVLKSRIPKWVGLLILVGIVIELASPIPIKARILFACLTMTFAALASRIARDSLRSIPIAALIILACVPVRSQAQSVKQRMLVSASEVATSGCDDAMWNRVYNPKRLETISKCVTVKGTVALSAPDDDGDQHFLLKLDSGQDGLLNKRNIKKKDGYLVVEIVCANPISVKKAKASCRGYTNRIAIPAVGSHVAVTGSYVVDTHNGWMEIHPVSKVTRL